MIDAILSHHISDHCGVSRFNRRLSRELGVPCLSLESTHDVSHPLISVMSCEDPKTWPLTATAYGQFDLFLHDKPSGIDHRQAIRQASRIYAGNAQIAAYIRASRADVIESFCPATIQGNPDRGAINVLTFGMAHKIQTAPYARLKRLLDQTGRDYTVSLSTAVHEGTPWDLTATVPEKLRSVFGKRLRYLGYLADDALARELHECSAVALFYDPALRANNTTAWAALDAGKPLITNLDQYSPGVVCENIATMEEWPESFITQQWTQHTWQTLVDQLRQPVNV